MHVDQGPTSCKLELALLELTLGVALRETSVQYKIANAIILSYNYYHKLAFIIICNHC